MNTLFSLELEIAVVTGALGKLGPVWIEALLDAGASVFALDLPGVAVSEDFQRLQDRFDEDRLSLQRTDIRDRSALEVACEQCIASFGVPSILVNNAGIDQPPANADDGYLLEDIPLEVNREILEVNTLGLFLVSQVFGKPMLRAGRGSIINIGSLYAGISPDAHFYDHIQSDPPFFKPPAYGASKAAVVNLTRYLATHWAPQGIRVNALSPGGVLGEQDEQFRGKFCHRVPMGRMAVNDDLCGPLLFLASRASSYVTGTELIVDGGFTAW
ncbi:3-oxoacyl-[acyl-carrier protein] reductase [hydrothermal vent metagenome]|uniref:3-oxoacyl-[acyl-carrier protein] reductase n=1 Tax=hydrothermal vent metagenome TaxID=652676 RepID=A0A3B0YU51_9ZZZZ